MWHLISLMFFLFSIVRFVVYLSERRIYQMPKEIDHFERGRRAAPQRGNSYLVDIAGSVRAETEKAYRFYDGKTTVWLPKSQCQWDEESQTMTMQEWLATEKGLN